MVGNVSIILIEHVDKVCPNILGPFLFTVYERFHTSRTDIQNTLFDCNCLATSLTNSKKGDLSTSYDRDIADQVPGERARKQQKYYILFNMLSIYGASRSGIIMQSTFIMLPRSKKDFSETNQ